MAFTIEVSREVDGRWIAEIRDPEGTVAALYGKTMADAICAVLEAAYLYHSN